MQKAKWLSEAALQIPVRRREAKNKGEKERYSHLNAELQRIAREIRKHSSVISAKKQRKTTEWERLEISSKKLEIPCGIFHAKMGTIKDINGMDQQKKKILRRGGKDTQKNYTKKMFMTQIITMV